MALALAGFARVFTGAKSQQEACQACDRPCLSARHAPEAGWRFEAAQVGCATPIMCCAVCAGFEGRTAGRRVSLTAPRAWRRVGRGEMANRTAGGMVRGD